MAASEGLNRIQGEDDSPFGEDQGVQVEIAPSHRGGNASGFSPLEDDEDPNSLEDVMGRRGRGGHARLETAWERSARRNQRLLFWALAVLAALLAILVGLVAIAIREGVHVGRPDDGYVSGHAREGEHRHESFGGQTSRMVSRIAFGSCTSKGAQDDPGQPIWTQSVIPAEPDAWIWLGDMAYLDHPTVNCELLPEDPDCVCRDNYMRVEPWCAAGDPHHGLRKFQTMVRNPEYNEFLDYMCPAARTLGVFPPPGTDGELCPRPILGTWDDHDFGWNDGDGRLEQKWLFKNMFLDAIGEDMASPRRNAHQGMWHKHVLNEGTDREIEVFLLDERYDRSPKPCYLRQQFCDKVLEAKDNGEDTSHTAWCADFLRGGHGGNGSCCPHDEQITFGWCLEPSSRDSPYWEEACDTSSRNFGKRWLVFDEVNSDVREPDGTEEVDSQDSPFCEVLGREQRAWLQRELDSSTASLRLIVSGSVMFGRPGNDSHTCEDETCQCSGDDWDCFRPAQQNLLSQIAGAPGCSVIITGDYHWGDIKAMLPGADTPYAEWYSSHDYDHPIYQVMGSGMTTSTAGKDRSCEGFIKDDVGLRLPGECDVVLDPNFGFLQVNFEEGLTGFSSLEMQVRDWNGTVRLSSTLTPDMCNPRMMPSEGSN